MVLGASQELERQIVASGVCVPSRPRRCHGFAGYGCPVSDEQALGRTAKERFSRGQRNECLVRFRVSVLEHLHELKCVHPVSERQLGASSHYDFGQSPTPCHLTL